MSNSPLLRRYHNLEPRDRQALRWLALFLGPVILIYGVLLPGYRYYQTAKNNYSAQTELLAWVQNQAPQVTAGQAAINPDKPQQPLMQVVTGSTSRFGIEVNRLQPEGEKLRAWLLQAPFAKSLEWLAELTREGGIAIEQIAVEKTGQPGLVNIQCLLSPE